MSLSKIKVNNIEIVGVDSKPIVDSSNLIKSGSVSEHGSAFDISSFNSGVSYADLASALGVDGANVPVNVRRGGMNVKFINSTNNKYEQWRYLGTSTENAYFVNISSWQSDESLKEYVKAEYAYNSVYSNSELQQYIILNKSIRNNGSL